MKAISRSSRTAWLLVGDIAALALVTVVGFATHGELATATLRMLTTFIPLSVAWLLVGPHLGVLTLERATDIRQVWRPFWAMILAAPLAAWLRGLWLNAPILPVFVAVLAGTSAVALLVWRVLFAWYMGRRAGQQVSPEKMNYG